MHLHNLRHGCGTMLKDVAHDFVDFHGLNEDAATALQHARPISSIVADVQLMQQIQRSPLSMH